MAFRRETFLRICLGLFTLIVTIQASDVLKNDRYTHSDQVVSLEKADYFHLESRDIRLLRVKRESPPINDTASPDTPSATTTTNAQETTTPTGAVAQTPVVEATTATTAPAAVMPPATTTPSQPTTPVATEAATGATGTPGSTEEPSTVTFPTGTKVSPDDHKYYQSNVRGSAEESLWVDMKLMEGGVVKHHGILSQSHRTAATVRLSFSFLFYGHYINQVTIATGGFLYMSDFLHQWLTATQYVAPLMANFDSRIGGENSNIHFVDNGTAFVVQWTNLHLQDQEYGPFTFQAVLLKEGVVIFNYKKVPRPIDDISVANHPVKIGFSDAFYIDRPIEGRPNVHRRTIYEYHRVEIKKTYIRNGTTIYIRPRSTCVQMSNCSSCFSPLVTKFTCTWCQKVRRCSDGMDRHRQKWLNSGCDTHGVQNASRHLCSTLDRQGRNAGAAVGAVIATFIIILVVVALAGWFYYAYKNPTTRSGMWLMEHRPSQLKMKMKFWKKEGASGDKYSVSVEPSGNESVA